MRARRHVPGTMNKLETRYAAHLDALVAAGEIRSWRFEEVKLKIAPLCFYTPDFFVVLNDDTVEQQGLWVWTLSSSVSGGLRWRRGRRRVDESCGDIGMDIFRRTQLWVLHWLGYIHTGGVENCRMEVLEYSASVVGIVYCIIRPFGNYCMDYGKQSGGTSAAYCISCAEGAKVNWKEQTVIRILLLVAKLIAPTPWAEDIKSLASHISVTAPKDGPVR